MAASLLLRRSVPLLLRSHLHILRFTACISTLEDSRPDSSASKSPPPPPPASTTPVMSCTEHTEYMNWVDRDNAMLADIGSISRLTKEILHSDRYMDGECLCPEDEQEVVDKLLPYHPCSEEKIGCGLKCIMVLYEKHENASLNIVNYLNGTCYELHAHVDRHPTFRKSRSLFVVRSDGVRIDFSHKKCLRAYIQKKYPFHAERFMKVSSRI